MTSRSRLLVILIAFVVSACGGSSSKDSSAVSNAQATATAIVQKANAEATARAIVDTTRSTAQAIAVVENKQAPTATTKSPSSAEARATRGSRRNAARPSTELTLTPRAKAAGAPRARAKNTATPPPKVTLYVDAADQGYSGVNLRTRPTSASRLVLLVRNGESLRADSRTIGGTEGERWYKVEYGTDRGYVLGSLVSTEKPAQVARPETEIITLYVDAAPYGYPAGVNLRSQPTTNSTIIETYENGTKLRVYDRRVAGPGGESWYEVALDSGKGYVLAKLVSENPSDPVTPVQPAGDTHEITYRVFGTASSVDILYSNASGGDSEANGRNLPWSRTFTVAGDPYVSILVSSDQESYNTVTCELLIDGQVVDTTKSDGTYYVSADCSN